MSGKGAGTVQPAGMMEHQSISAPSRLPTKIDIKAAVSLSAIIWFGHLAVIITSSLASNMVDGWRAQLARVLIALAGFSSCVILHLALPRRSPERFWRTLGETLVVCLLVAALITVYSYYQFAWLVPARGKPIGLLTDFAISYAYYCWIFVSWAALYTGLGTVQEMLERGRRAAQLEAQANEARLQALRYQLNPHFFFNVLNTLSGLVSRKRLAEAESVILNMADFLRYSLAGPANDEVTLKDEIAAQCNYLDIEKIRFGDRLRLSIDVPAECESALVPALILQPLVENAVKHGVGRSELPVDLRISAWCTLLRLGCSVENGPPGEGEAATPGLNMGLRNVAQRLQAIYGGEAALDHGPTPDGGWRAEVKLPLRRGAA